MRFISLPFAVGSRLYSTVGYMSPSIKIGIIGGSGLDDPKLFENRREKTVTTPFGPPSDNLICGEIGGVPCVLLARHGRRHSIMPSNVNFRANIHALKEEGCDFILVTTACGSLREEIAPGEIVILDQFIDRTTKRAQTFYDGSTAEYEGVYHVSQHTPFCPHLRTILNETAADLSIKHHSRGTNITIEGPRFSSRAESILFKSWDASIINMTTVPEVVLANEAGLSYAAIALVTDYDSWREEEGAEHVDVQVVMRNLRLAADNATKLLLAVIPKLGARDWSEIIQKKKKSVQDSIMG